MKTAVLILTMSIVTILLRALPFLVFHRKVPSYIAYLGRVLPPAIIGMLVIYCLKDVSLLKAPFALPEFVSAVLVVLIQVWKRNSILSILSGTVIYMLIMAGIG